MAQGSRDDGSGAGICVGAIAPHGEMIIAETCDDATRELARHTRDAMEELGRRVLAARPETLVVVTPHNVHVGGSMAVIAAARMRGRLDEVAHPVELECGVDRELAGAIVESLRDYGIPAVSVSFGGNNSDEAVAPLDWGALVPLWFLGARAGQAPRVVVISPSRDLDGAAHLRAGAAVAGAARATGRRVAMVASADQGHGHRADGPYGFHSESAAFDERVAAIVREGRIAGLAGIPEADARTAVADSWWQMLMLVGALPDEAHAELLSYEAPTYYGMLTAIVEPPGPAVS